MTIDERVRDALHAYADPIEPAPGSWDRIEARLDDRLPRERRPRTPLLVAAVGILVIVALIAAALVRDLDDGSNVISDPGVVAGMPGLAVAVTTDGSVVVLDAETGAVLDQRVARGTTSGRSIAVSADGRSAYLVGASGDSTCEFRELYRLPLDSASRSLDPIGSRASAPALSPDGRYLAYLRCSNGMTRPDQIVLRDLATNVERVTSGPPSLVLGAAPHLRERLAPCARRHRQRPPPGRPRRRGGAPGRGPRDRRVGHAARSARRPVPRVEGQRHSPRGERTGTLHRRSPVHGAGRADGARGRRFRQPRPRVHGGRRALPMERRRRVPDQGRQRDRHRGLDPGECSAGTEAGTGDAGPAAPARAGLRDHGARCRLDGDPAVGDPGWGRRHGLGRRDPRRHPRGRVRRLRVRRAEVGQLDLRQRRLDLPPTDRAGRARRRRDLERHRAGGESGREVPRVPRLRGQPGRSSGRAPRPGDRSDPVHVRHRGATTRPPASSSPPTRRGCSWPRSRFRPARMSGSRWTWSTVGSAAAGR